MTTDGLMELVRTGAFALWALVVWIAVQELKKIREGIVGGRHTKTPEANGTAIYDRMARLETKLDAFLQEKEPKP